MRVRAARAFTVIELLVSVSIITLLVSILLPAIGTARDQAKLSISLSNLRNLGTAHQSYAAAWNDRQYTAVIDNVAAYGVLENAFDNYGLSNGSEGGSNDPGNPPPIYVGWGWYEPTTQYVMLGYRTKRGQVANACLALPIVFESATRPEQGADGRMRTQTGNAKWGLWSKDTVWEDDGYLISYSYDQAATSFHILTTDGIRGRDVTAE